MIFPLKTLHTNDVLSILIQYFNSQQEQNFLGKNKNFCPKAKTSKDFKFRSLELKNKACNVINASSDIDVDIVKAAVESFHHKLTTLIGEDTDLLILSLHYADFNDNLCFRSDKTGATKVYNINKTKHVFGKD